MDDDEEKRGIVAALLPLVCLCPCLTCSPSPHSPLPYLSLLAPLALDLLALALTHPARLTHPRPCSPRSQSVAGAARLRLNDRTRGPKKYTPSTPLGDVLVKIKSVLERFLKKEITFHF